jgi:hypothetical protein
LTVAAPPVAPHLTLPMAAILLRGLAPVNWKRPDWKRPDYLPRSGASAMRIAAGG